MRESLTSISLATGGGLAEDVAGYSRLMAADEAGKMITPGEQRHAVAAAAGRHVP
jgi:hypothetical protein